MSSVASSRPVSRPRMFRWTYWLPFPRSGVSTTCLELIPWIPWFYRPSVSWWWKCGGIEVGCSWRLNWACQIGCEQRNEQFSAKIRETQRCHRKGLFLAPITPPRIPVKNCYNDVLSEAFWTKNGYNPLNYHYEYNWYATITVEHTLTFFNVTDRKYSGINLVAPFTDAWQQRSTYAAL